MEVNDEEIKCFYASGGDVVAVSVESPKGITLVTDTVVELLNLFVKYEDSMEAYVSDAQARDDLLKILSKSTLHSDS